MPRDCEYTYMSQRQYTAIFQTWILPNGQKVPAKFTVLLRLRSGKNFRWCPLLFPTMQPITVEWQGKKTDSFPELDLEDAKKAVAKIFETQLTEWE